MRASLSLFLALGVTLFSGCVMQERRVTVGLPHDRNYGAPMEFSHQMSPRGEIELQNAWASSPIGETLGKYFMTRKSTYDYIVGTDGQKYRREGRLWVPVH